ncbi:MAG TPA: phosphatidate cytidylyltransferase, partial [Lacipirellulaceae bacterium]|nr:phosphatidate cytidylyltransferase [Lacipirellulaceae bacterium]
VFLFFTPMQFLLVWYDNYGLYSILIPVYAFLFIAVRAAISGDFDRFLERIAKVQCGLMICVYCLSFAPAMLYLQLQSDARGEDPYAKQRMLCFFVTIVLLADLLEWVWSRIYGQHIIAEKIDPQLSWEGVLASAVCVSIAGAALYWATPFSNFWQSAAMSLLIALMAAAGSLAMAAIKRDRGDLVTGAFTEGQGGVLSRIDSICFAAPVFYHVTRYFFAAA